MTKKDKLYLLMAFILAQNSCAIRRKVGCLIVKEGSIISDGYNDTPAGFPKVCEYLVKGDTEIHSTTPEELRQQLSANEDMQLFTYPYVIHAECNAITKLAKYGKAVEGATIFITDEPCMECAKLIIQAGIDRVVYSREYRLHDGLKLLEKSGVLVDIIPIDEISSVI